MCRYWYGIGVVTMRSADLSASSTSWQSRKTSSAAFAEVADPAVVLDDGGYLGHAHVRAIPGPSVPNSSSSILSLTMSGTLGLPPRSWSSARRR